MFNRYFRSYPWFLQLLLYILMIFTLVSFFSVIQLAILPKLLGIQYEEMAKVTTASPRKLINASLIFQAITHASIFLLPSLLFAHLTHPEPMQYLGLRRPAKGMHLLLAAGIMLGTMPLLAAIGEWMTAIDMGAKMNEMHLRNKSLTEAYMQQRTFAQFLGATTVLALLPALGEELLFRGVLLRFAHKRSNSMAFPIAINALMFAGIHFSPYGFVPILLAGILLCMIYFWTGSLWCSILAHFLFNGSQVALHYIARNDKALQQTVKDDAMPIGLIIGGIVIAAACFYGLWKSRTPLPHNWSDDYTPEERAAFSK